MGLIARSWQTQRIRRRQFLVVGVAGLPALGVLGSMAARAEETMDALPHVRRHCASRNGGWATTGQALVRLMHQRGAKVVAAIDRRAERIGRDVGDVAGKIGAVGVSVVGQEDAEQVLRAARPDVCVVAARTRFRDVYDQLMTAAGLGINCINHSEEAFHPWNTEPELARRVDALAREHVCTVTASGMNDTLVGGLLNLLAASSAQVAGLRWTLQIDVDGGGRLANEHGVGFDRECFAREMEPRREPVYSRSHVEWPRVVTSRNVP